MAVDGFTVDLASILALSTKFEQTARELETAFATWQTGADALRTGLDGIPNSAETDLLASSKARQVLTVTGLATWAVQLTAWWESTALADHQSADGFGLTELGGAPLSALPAPPPPADRDELR